MLQRPLATALRQTGRRIAASAPRATSTPIMRLSSQFTSSPATANYIFSSRRFYATNGEPKPESGPTAEAEGGEELSEVEKKVQELEASLAAKDRDITDLKDKYLRQVADFRNLQETTKREIQNSKDYAIQKFARDLLESVDNLERALANVPEDQRTQEQENETDQALISLYDGVRMTQQVLEQTLKQHGLEKIDPLGERFDPHRHEATFEVTQLDKEPGTVFFVQQTGFTLNNRVLRAAKVGVVKQE
ncbi:GrpE-domain-containing protein [Lipomyces tetrasporus]|uniref:GrpE protein homolog n=1 Tax=Lipomyces tetrasporus TaxID=54092 RepID=A0AAD7VP52_9ASCO|nr:GrpE-domain-containing protein [Lipomyces tetrasporus]KAJ8097342.1 GrpE-domain-containing protein [Lipomyces tetrasporus]